MGDKKDVDFSLSEKNTYELINENGMFRLFMISGMLMMADISLKIGAFPYVHIPMLHQDDWIIMNYCLNGRCEVLVKDKGTTIIKPGDFTINRTSLTPEGYSYPMGFYEGIELFISPNLLDDPSFQLLKADGFSLQEQFPPLMWEPLISSQNKGINDRMDSIRKYVLNQDYTRSKLTLMQLFLDLRDIRLENEQPVYYPRKQLDIARNVHALLTEDISSPYHLTELAENYHISVSSLNNYFSALYGNTIPVFMRALRMDTAKDLLLTTNKPIGEIAAMTGYTNASKFCVAFTKHTGQKPSQYRSGK